MTQARGDGDPRTNGRRLLLGFMWSSIGLWAFALGAKVFDLLVLGTAWSAHLPDSLALMPYGLRYPVDPGNFFQPLSVLLAIATVGTLALGWRRPKPLRFWLCLPPAALAVIWVLTPTIFWPIIVDLWEASRGRNPLTVVELTALAHRWFVWDPVRIALLAAGFVAQARGLMIEAAHGATTGSGQARRRVVAASLSSGGPMRP